MALPISPPFSSSEGSRQRNTACALSISAKMSSAKPRRRNCSGRRTNSACRRWRPLCAASISPWPATRGTTSGFIPSIALLAQRGGFAANPQGRHPHLPTRLLRPSRQRAGTAAQSPASKKPRRGDAGAGRRARATGSSILASGACPTSSPTGRPRPEGGSLADQRSNGAKTIAVHDGDKPIGAISIPAKEVLTDYALLPPGEIRRCPSWRSPPTMAESRSLVIYNAKSGEPLREFTGHKERLRSLAFAPDGRLLVSTRRRWDRLRVVSDRPHRRSWDDDGRLPGVSRRPARRGRRPWRSKVEDDSPAHGKLKPGDLLAGLVEKKKLRRIDSPRSLLRSALPR